MSDVAELTMDRPGALRFDQGPLEGTWFTWMSDGVHHGHWRIETCLGDPDPTDPFTPTAWDYDDEDYDTVVVVTFNGWHHHYARTMEDPGTWLYVATCHPESVG